jgi:hypothetical protein
VKVVLLRVFPLLPCPAQPLFHWVRHAWPSLWVDVARTWSWQSPSLSVELKTSRVLPHFCIYTSVAWCFTALPFIVDMRGEKFWIWDVWNMHGQDVLDYWHTRWSIYLSVVWENISFCHGWSHLRQCACCMHQRDPRHIQMLAGKCKGKS